MELSRLIRVLRQRWLVVVLLGTIGFLSAFGFTVLTNRTAEDRWEALVALRFDPGEGQTIDDLAQDLQDTAGLATLAAEELLSANPGSSIFTDPPTGRLFFRAEADTEDLAIQHANDLLRAYVNSDQGGGGIQPQLVDLALQAEELTRQIEEMQVVLTAEERQLVAQHEVVDLSTAAVRDRLVQLAVADAGASDDVRTANAAEREQLNAALTDLLIQKQSLSPKPDESLSAADQLRLNALTRQLELVGVEYERLSLRSAGILSENTTQELPRTTNLAPPPASPVRNGVIGLMAGVAMAVFGLVFVTRSRREVWLGEDLPVPLLGELPDRRVTVDPGPSWYDTTTTGRRKESIQTIRTAIDSALSHGGAAFALAGDRLGALSTHALAVDLAAAFASAGRAVLLVDTDFGGEVAMTEFAVGEPTMGSILRTPASGAAGVEGKLAEMLGDVVHVRSGLAVLPAGPSPDSPADALAGPRFRRFMEMARERFELVIAVGGEAASASSQVLMQRVGMGVLAVTPGATTVPRIDGVLVDLAQQNVAVPGMIIVHGKEARISLPKASATKKAPEPSIRKEDSQPISRLEFYPFPGSKRTVGPAEGSLGYLAGGLTGSVAGADSGVGNDLLEVLSGMDPAKALDPVADYVVARVEDILSAVPGQDHVSDRLIDVVRDDGFIPLTEVRGFATVGEWLVREIESEAGEGVGTELSATIARILSGSNYMGPAESLDAWLRRQFFPRHLERTEREPNVWHLTSSVGTIQLLVAARQLTDDRLASMSISVVRRVIGDLENDLRTAVNSGDEELIEELEDNLRDAHKFEATVGILRGGGSDEARLRYPWRRAEDNPTHWAPVWSEGIRANIAPLQRLGILSAPVLTDAELNELTPVG